MIASAGLGLLAGLAIGYVGHILSVRRTKHERSINDATELWDRCGDIAAARVKYILAYHRRLPDAKAAREDHLDLKRRYRWADPEVVLAGVPEWETYHAAERAAVRDDSIPTKEHIKRVEATSYALFEAIGKRRAEARR